MSTAAATICTASIRSRNTTRAHAAVDRDPMLMGLKSRDRVDRLGMQLRNHATSRCWRQHQRV